MGQLCILLDEMGLDEMGLDEMAINRVFERENETLTRERLWEKNEILLIFWVKETLKEWEMKNRDRTRKSLIASLSVVSVSFSYTGLFCKFLSYWFVVFLLVDYLIISTITTLIHY